VELRRIKYSKKKPKTGTGIKEVPARSAV